MEKKCFTFHVSRFSLTLSIVLAILSLCRTSLANTITEDFSTNPLQNGWSIFGDTNLFQWDSTNQDLAVTWDSSQTNSYFYRSLGTILAIDSDFSLEFDINLSSVTTANGGSQLAVGFLNLADATSTNFLRTLGTCTNVAEFDYFPPTADPPSIDATLVDASNNFYFVYNDLPLNPGTVYHVLIAHAAGDQTITGAVFTNGVLYAPLTNVFASSFTDFRLDTIAVSSYQEDGFGDSIFAQGTIANLVITLPPPPVQNLTGAFNNGPWQVQFTSQTNWLYTLQSSPDLFSWTDISATVPGVEGTFSLSDTNALSSQAFYRVRAQRP